jgi:hypothetical protein
MLTLAAVAALKTTDMVAPSVASGMAILARIDEGTDPLALDGTEDGGGVSKSVLNRRPEAR